MNEYRFDKQLHCHTLDGKPLHGCSTVVGVIAKNLTWWASGKAVETLGWTNPKTTKIADRVIAAKPIWDMVVKTSVEGYLALLDTAYKNHSVKLKDSAQKGTDLHAELERFVKYSMESINFDLLKKPLCFSPQIFPFIVWANKNVKKFIASEAHTYSERLWCGGIVDAVALLKDGSYAVIDFKSAKTCYPSHLIQAAGYGLMLEENGICDGDGKFIWRLPEEDENGPVTYEIDKVIVVPFGAKEVVPVIKQAEPYKQGFKNALELFKLVNQEG